MCEWRVPLLRDDGFTNWQFLRSTPRYCLDSLDTERPAVAIFWEEIPDKGFVSSFETIGRHAPRLMVSSTLVFRATPNQRCTVAQPNTGFRAMCRVAS